MWIPVHVVYKKYGPCIQFILSKLLSLPAPEAANVKWAAAVKLRCRALAGLDNDQAVGEQWKVRLACVDDVMLLSRDCLLDVRRLT